MLDDLRDRSAEPKMLYDNLVPLEFYNAKSNTVVKYYPIPNSLQRCDHEAVAESLRYGIML